MQIHASRPCTQHPVQIHGQGRAHDLIYSNPLNVEHLLLNHFSSSVSLTLSDRTDFRTVWSLYLPRDGYDHPYLMHSMLAIAALHIAHIAKPDNQFNISYYTDLAIYHHDMALSLLSPHVTAVTPENFDALYASSMLALLFNAGLLKSSDSSRLFHDIAALSELGKGVLAIRQEGIQKHEIKSSHLVRYYYPWDRPPPLPEYVYRTIENIEKVVCSLPATGQQSENRAHYDHAVRVLRMTFNALNMNRDQPPMVFMWFVLVEREYVELVKSRDAIALLILAHYAICVLHIRDKWWAASFGAHIVAAVHDILDDCEVLGF